jgi:hypothetical protein
VKIALGFKKENGISLGDVNFDVYMYTGLGKLSSFLNIKLGNISFPNIKIISRTER